MISAEKLRELLDRHGHAVIAWVSEAKGSAPRDAGAAMVIHAEGAEGSIGGGSVEYQTIERAGEILKSGTVERDVLDFRLGPEIDQCCGGSMRVELRLIDRIATADLSKLCAGAIEPSGDPSPRPVFVYGAGHVGNALVRALVPLPFQITWVDARAGQPVVPGVDLLETPLPEAVAATAPPDAMHIVMTHSHALDLEIVAEIMTGDFAFCGLIGSATKRTLFERRLAERVIAVQNIARLTCPIGLPGLRDKRPEVIAASVAAQLLQIDAALDSDRLAILAR